ncbi:LptA/OstA family protein [Ahrensia sp. R2A130]|uniref:LptA/OstA family protein n=1 Tax=Ahrensia sp. R2A130 TaxID=744979 RepID=UPI0001E0C333|nr:LptA/OstA family protein [Ahrensia sp. R2A130]EFL90811.1 OstA family protein [Ahrensia sp. R2A130]
MIRTTLLALGLAAAVATSALAQVSGAAFDGFRSNGKDPIQIEADSLEVLDEQNKAVFNGNVVVVQGKSTMTTSKLIVTYGAGGQGTQRDVQKLEMFEGLVATSEENTVTADKGIYITATEQITLTGKVVVSQGADNVATGCKLVANLNNNQARMTACPKGRTTVTFTPGTQKKN